MITNKSTISIKNKLKKIRLIVSDVDGVLTDGMIRLVGDEEMKVFNGKDAMRIDMLIRSGIPLVWVTGRKCKAVIERSKELNVHLIFKKDLHDKKISLVKELNKIFGTSQEEALYIGDDWGDLFLMKQFGLSATPRNGSKENKKIADIITDAEGGNGVMAELIEKVMRWQLFFKKICVSILPFL